MLRFILVSPRAPRNRALHSWALPRIVIYCMLSAGVGMLFLPLLLASDVPFEVASVAVVLLVFSVNFLGHWRGTKYSVYNALEMAAGQAMYVASLFVSPSLRVVLLGIAFVAILRPFTEGPEPGGWGPIYDQLEKEKKLAEENRLKGRHEK